MIRQSNVDVVAGRILARPSLADLFACQRVPGGRWDAAAKAWSYPATHHHAVALRAALRALRATDEFSALLASASAPASPAQEPPPPPPTAAPAPPPEPQFPIPAGLKKRPWTHQLGGFAFTMRLIASGIFGVLLAMGMGTGKTLVAWMLVLALRAMRVLIVCPLRVVPVWVKQYAEHVAVPMIVVALDEDAGSVAKKRDLAAEKLKLAQALGQPFIMVVNYDSVWREPLAAWCEKQSWDLVIADECVPGDSAIATPDGAVPIHSLKAGDAVFGVDEGGRIVTAHVTATFRRYTTRPLVQVDALVATDNHPVWVEGRGYVPASEVCPGDRVLVYGNNSHNHLRMVRSVVYEDAVRRKPEPALLQQGMFGAVEDVAAGVRGGDHCKTGSESDVRGDDAELGESGVRRATPYVPEVGAESVSRSGSESEGRSGAARAGLSDAQRREWNWADEAAENARGPLGVADGVHCADKDAARLRVSQSLQAGHREPGSDDLRGSRWPQPFGEARDRAGCQEGRVPGESGLECGARNEPGGLDGLRSRGAAHLVFNIETSTGNYFANGILVHNCHRLKSPSGKASLFFKRLRKFAKVRVGLSGTPMPHGPLDIFAIFRFLQIQIFGPSYSSYKQRFAIMGGFQRKQVTGFQRLDELEKLMAQITFRVGKEVLDLPPETHVTYYCALTGEAARIYKDLEEDFVAQVRDGVVTAANALVKLLRLQQLTGGCLRTDDGVEHRIDTAKLRLLIDTLMDTGRDEPTVIFTRFHADLDAVHEACAELGYGCMELSGRRDELARWQAGEGQVLAAQISSGGVGVDLTRARYSIYYSLSFSLGEYDQSLSRVHRPGQTRPVTHVHLIARGTVDEKIMRALEKRAEVVQAILAEIQH